MELPKLYKKGSTGAIQEWTVSVEGNNIKTSHGQVGGKLQESVEEITQGKNLGKANATTPEQQALSEAQARWQKKVDKGYVPDMTRANKSETDIEGGVFPMLAQSYDKHAKKITFPALAQPKLDGIRIIAVIEDGAATLWTRSRKPVTGLPHIIKALEALYSGQKSVILDGEAYNHDLKSDFEKIVSCVRSEAPKEDHEIVQYHVYDAIDEKSGYTARTKEWRRLFSKFDPSGPLKSVLTVAVNSHEELMSFHQDCVEEGYEGAMVRNANAVYAANKRSYDLQKVKFMEDSDYPIIGVRAGRGKMADLAIFTCLTPKGQTFDVKLKGAMADLAKYLKDDSTWKSKLMVVQYQNLTGDGLPRFPIGIRIREPGL